MNIKTNIKRLFKAFTKGKEGGYTLLEVTAVVAVTGILAAVTLTTVKTTYENSKLTSVEQDIQSYINALQTFFDDTGDWPVRRNKSISDHFEILFSGHELKGKLSQRLSGGPSDRIYNHLYQNNPEDANFGAYTGWKQRYITSEDKFDPWGNSYLIYVKPLWAEREFVDQDKQVAWIISAGANEEFETGPFDSVIQGDDIGLPFATGPNVGQSLIIESEGGEI